MTTYIEAGAWIEGDYRYRLWRSWPKAIFASNVSKITFGMLNPSTADGREDDPTIRRVVGFAKTWGFCRLEVLNLFPYRATDPKEVAAAKDPFGDSGRFEDAANEALCGTDLIVVAWGAAAAIPTARIAIAKDRLLGFFERASAPIVCLGKTLDGEPRHPLYVPKNAIPEPWSPAGA